MLERLVDIVRESRCECIALSGGIDTSVILLAAVSAGLKPRAYTLFYEHGVPRDLVYADFLAKRFNLDLTYIELDRARAEEIKDKILECVGSEKILSHGDSGCIELRNDLVYYQVLWRAREDKCNCIYTGSGGDELFGGYSFMNMLTSEELDKTIKNMISGRFPELEIARCLETRVVAPYLDERIVKLGLETPVDCLRSTAMQGKEVLREILREKDLYIVSERIKTPAESGAGTKSFCRSVYDSF